MSEIVYNKKTELEVDMKTRKAYDFERYLIELSDGIEEELEELMLEIMELEAFQKCQKETFENLPEEIVQGYYIECTDKKEELKVLTEQFKVYRHIINNFDEYKEMDDKDILKTMFLIETKRSI